MANQLSLIVCGSFDKEIRSVSGLPELKNVEIAALPFDCDQVDGGWDGLGSLVRKELDAGRTVYVAGGFCLTQALAALGSHNGVLPFQKSQCAEWAADKDVLDKFLQEESLIVLPGWLRSWERVVAAKWKGDRKKAQAFFREASRKIVLIDTGVYPKIDRELKEFSQFLRLPAEKYPAGLSHFGLSLAHLAQSWRLEREAEASEGRVSGIRQKMADYGRLGHLLGPLARDLAEEDAIAGILDVVRVLLSPQSVAFHSARTLSGLAKPEGSALDRILSLNADYAWSDDRRNVFLSVTYGRRVLGVLEVIGLPAPERSELDLSLGLALAKVAGLALANAASLRALSEESEKAEAAQTALKASEEKVLSVYQGSPVGLYRMTPAGEFVDANPAMARMLGFTDTAQLRAVNAWELHLNPGDRESWQSVLEGSHFNETFETQLRRRDGTVVWVRDTARAVRDRLGRTVFFDGALEDITKRKQMDSASSWNLQFRTSLAAVSGRLLTTASIEDMSGLILEHARRLTSSPTCIVAYRDDRGDRFRPGALTSDAAALSGRLPEGGGWALEGSTGLWGWVLKNKKPLLTNLPSVDPRFNRLPEWHFPVTQFLCVPALAGEDLVGMIAVANSETPYSEREIDAVGRLAELYAIAIYRLRADEKLQEMSLVDELTRLYNRRGFLTLAEQQFRVAHRSRKEMYLLYADLDDLKMINDRFGHETGDAALAETAALLKEVFRESDIIARMGGDEFVILAVDVGEGKADVLAQRLKERFAARNAQPGQPLALSISVGVACYDPESTASIQDLITSADKRMYVDKESRRRPGPSRDETADVRP